MLQQIDYKERWRSGLLIKKHLRNIKIITMHGSHLNTGENKL